MSFTVRDALFSPVANFLAWLVAHASSAIRSGMLWASNASFISFIMGILTLNLGKILLRMLKKSKRADHHSPESTIYSLDHGRLNLELPPKTMWMNMGYWEHTNDFPTACRTLLEEVLKTAGLLSSKVEVEIRSPSGFQILDLGFGCGDQTVYLTREAFATWQDADLEPNRPVLSRYVGITLDRKQFHFTRQRLHKHGIHEDDLYLAIFCADAAKPASWPEDLSSAVKPHRLQCAGTNDTWVLALDTFYHFSPSRWPIINYVRGELYASLMAFDLILSDNVSLLNRLLLRLVCSLSDSPIANFVTMEQYRRKLTQAGYAEEKIEIKDVSENVFAPLAKFLGNRENELKAIGLGIGGFKVARWMFRWWAKSGIVRGVIVVARK